MKCLIDVNVLIDAALNREPFASDARRFFDAAADRDVALCVAAISITTLFYLVEKVGGTLAAFRAVDQVLAATTILSVDESVIRAARKWAGNDFEDNVQIACATTARADLIVTRDPRGFHAAPIRTVGPSEAAAIILVGS